MAKHDLASLRPNPKNPRKVTDKKLQMLKKSMAEFGDLSGIVQLDSDGTLVGGHQRVEAFRTDPAASIEVTQRFDPPLPDGTLASGHVWAAGARFAYRLVNFTLSKAKAASLAANKNAGSWDLPLLAEAIGDLQHEDVDPDTTMFDRAERDSLLGEQVPDAPMGKDDAALRSKPIQCPACGHEWSGRETT